MTQIKKIAFWTLFGPLLAFAVVIGSCFYLSLPQEDSLWTILFVSLLTLCLTVVILSLREVFVLLTSWQYEGKAQKEEVQRLLVKQRELHAEWDLARKALVEELYNKNIEMTKMRSLLRKQPEPVVIIKEEPVARDIKEALDLYKQLRVQFEEKCEVLHHSRAQVFKLEGQLLALYKEREQEDDASTRALQDLLNESLEEKQYLEGEVDVLHEIVTVLSH